MRAARFAEPRLPRPSSTIPKGEARPGEDLLTRARIEFEEELGVEPAGN